MLNRNYLLLMGIVCFGVSGGVPQFASAQEASDDFPRVCALKTQRAYAKGTGEAAEVREGVPPKFFPTHLRCVNEPGTDGKRQVVLRLATLNAQKEPFLDKRAAVYFIPSSGEDKDWANCQNALRLLSGKKVASDAPGWVRLAPPIALGGLVTVSYGCTDWFVGKSNCRPQISVVRDRALCDADQELNILAELKAAQIPPYSDTSNKDDGVARAVAVVNGANSQNSGIQSFDDVRQKQGSVAAQKKKVPVYCEIPVIGYACEIRTSLGGEIDSPAAAGK